MRRLLAPVVLGVLVVAATGACRTPSALERGQLRVHLDEGAALEVDSGDGTFSAVDDGDVITSGSTIRGRAGEPRLELVDGSEVLVGPDARLEFARTLRVDEGEVLVRSTAPAVIATPLTTVRSTGVARVGQARATTVRVYEGAAMVTSHGRALRVPALRQTAVADGGLVPRQAAPISWTVGDRWDERYLAPVIELTDQLEGQSRGFGRQAANASTADIASLVGLPGSALESKVTNRSTGDTLVGGALVAAGARNATAVFTLRDAGAPWGVVAVEQVADPSQAVAVVRTAIERWLQRSARAMAAGQPEPAPAPTAAPPTAPAPSGAPPTAPEGSPVPAPAPQGSEPLVTVPPLPPLPLPPVTVPPSPVPPVIDGVSQVLGGAVDLLAGD